MSEVDTKTVAMLLREYAQRTSLRGGNPYRAKAYFRAADSLAALAVPLDVLVAAAALASPPSNLSLRSAGEPPFTNDW